MCRGEDVLPASSTTSISDSITSSSSINSTTSSDDDASPTTTKLDAVLLPPTTSNTNTTKNEYEKGRAEDGACIQGSLRIKHDKQQAPDDKLRIGILGQWYDVTQFAKHHPGGDIIYDFMNCDATAQFLAYHDLSVLDKYKLKKSTETYEYNIEQPGGSKFQGAWMKLNDKFEKEGRYTTPISFLFSRIAILVVSFIFMIIGIQYYLDTATHIHNHSIRCIPYCMYGYGNDMATIGFHYARYDA